MEEADLLKKAKNRDKEAFGQIYDLYAVRLFKYIRIRIGGTQDAEDVLQDTFVKAWNGLRTLKLEDLRFSAWIYQVARNCVNDHYRKTKRTPQAFELNENLDAPSEIDLEASLSNQFDLDKIKRAFSLLSEPHREILELRFISDFSVAETARILGKTSLAVRLAQYRALKRLREYSKRLS